MCGVLAGRTNIGDEEVTNHPTHIYNISTPTQIIRWKDLQQSCNSASEIMKGAYQKTNLSDDYNYRYYNH